MVKEVDKQSVAVEQGFIEHPPHVHRLLRLIREGTTSHASRASVLLGRYAASCCTGVNVVGTKDIDGASQDDSNDNASQHTPVINPGLIIWDLIGILVGGDGHINSNNNTGAATSSSSGGKKRRGNKKNNNNNRPTSGLFDTNWSTRTNCAVALEHVAKCLPLEDRRHFFEDDYNEVDNDKVDYKKNKCNEEEVLLWLSVNDLYKPINDTEEKKAAALPIKSEEIHQLGNNDTLCSSSLKKNAHKQNQLDIVAERGRLLLSSSGEQYDWDCDNETKEYIREQEALYNLDATANQQQTTEFDNKSKDDTNNNLQQSFLMRRVALQRKILARRLGLGGILSAPIVAKGSSTKSDELVADEDLAPVSVVKSEEKTTLNSSKKKNGATKKKSTKRKRVVDESDTNDNNQTKAPGMNIRALLVLESKRSASEASGTNDKRARHRNPQTLLGSELAYRTFDPDWTVRHGALLGTLALLRAWKVHQPPHTSSNGNNKMNIITRNKFGKWPQDILARCVCILSLDQFADFSGTDCNSEETSATDDIVSGAIVAPVREMAAQIIAILLEAACPETKACTHDLLMQLYTQEYRKKEVGSNNNGWEIRHSVLLAWKYNCAMTLFHSSSRVSEISSLSDQAHMIRPLSARFQSETSLQQLNGSILSNIILQSIRGLSDDSDDNRAVAAQVLRHSLLIDASLHNVDIAKECSEPMLDAIRVIRCGLSSCASDLLQLLAALLSRDCTYFMKCLGHGSGHSSLGNMLEKVADFVDDDSHHIKISCFRALRLMAQPIAKSMFDYFNRLRPSDYKYTDSYRTYMTGCAGILCDIPNKLFETYFNIEYMCKGDGEEDDNDQATELSNSRNQAWCAILDAIHLLTQSKAADARSFTDQTFTTLTFRYLGISREYKSFDPDTFRLTRIADSGVRRQGASENSFRFRLASAKALAEFHERIYSKERSSILSNLIHSILQSPWLSHCEAGCILHSCIASSAKSVEETRFVKYLPLINNTFEQDPTSILLGEHALSSSALDDPKVQTRCDNKLALLFDISEDCSSEEVVQTWKKIFGKKGVSFDDLRQSSNNTVPTKTSMRLSALMSGALIACGAEHLPPKVTPLIRALMTSLKNEESDSRRAETCHSISKLVIILSEHPTHKNVRDKVIDSVCSIACNRDINESSNPAKAAAHVIELFISDINTSDPSKDLVPIEKWMVNLSSFDCSNSEEHDIYGSIQMLQIISGAICKDSPYFKHLFVRLGLAVEVACELKTENLRAKACASIHNFCKIDFSTSMDRILPPLLTKLTSLEDDQCREGACKLLLSILQDFEVLLSPYVTKLLPVAMRLMTDSVTECSRVGASAFAILVRIAPLAATHIDKDEGTQSNQNSSDSVIRHLILGKPLPPIDLPEDVLSHLQNSGTTLRPYQMEGISWLNFLTDVHLNGALCDDMGLGKTLQALIAVAISQHKSKSIVESTASGQTKKRQSLVICPSSVVGHWVSEIKRFFPGNEVFVPFDFTGSAKARRTAWQKEVHTSNIIVTSYSVLRSDINLLENILWDYCILDEGHLLKNPKTCKCYMSSFALSTCHNID